MTDRIRVRFAPSPTGFLHVGGARTALFNWLWARKNNGVFILRIEDTDTERSTDASVEQIFDSLQWLGLNWDEGPFFQSQRTDLYMQHLDRLWKEGKIYPAFETKQELEADRDKAAAEKRNYLYDRRSLKLDPDEVQRRMQAGTPFVWRFLSPDEGVTEVKETLLGGEQTSFDNARMDDFIITRPGTVENPGMPLYNFVCAVDDALMQITHVIRGADHLTNTAKQVLIYRALGYEPPTFTHLPLIMKANKKMSKRDADADPRFPVSVSARRDLGYLREATVNFLALLGWSFPNDREIFAVEELIEAFALERLQKSNANFDEDKYIHLNGVYIRSLEKSTLTARVVPFLEAAGFPVRDCEAAWLESAVGLVSERMRLLSEFPDAMAYFFDAPGSYDEKGVRKVFLKEEGTAELLAEAAGALEKVGSFTREAVEGALRVFCEERELGLGRIAQPVRLAVTGRTASPGLFEVLELVGREQTVERIRRAAELLQTGKLP